MNLETAKRMAKSNLGLKALTFGAACAMLATGCSPQEKSRMWGSFTQLPDPPPEARLQIGVSTEADGTLFINYVCWETNAQKFIRKDIHYSIMSDHVIAFIPNNSFREAGGYIQRIKDGEVLSGGQVVNQTGKTIMIGGGLFIDGPTGNVINQSGQVVKALGQ